MVKRRSKKTKGQLSIETLLIYGTVLLVATLAISALVYFGVLDLGALLPDRCQLGGSELICETYVGVAGTSTLSLELRNNIGKNIEITDLKIIGEDDWTGTDFDTSPMWDDTGNGDPTKPLSTAVGERAPVNNGALSSVLKVTSTGAVNVGDKYKGRLTVTFKAKGSNIAQTKTGTILLTFT